MALTKVSTGMIETGAASVDLDIDSGTLYIDVTNSRVGVSNSSPATALDITGTATATLFSGSGASLTNIPNVALDNSSITINSYSTVLGGTVTLSTSDVGEGTNLYYTDTRADARIAAATTDNLSEGSSNLYYTDARADARVSLIVGAAPGTLNTLNELAAALGDDANFSTTVTNSIAEKLPLAGGTMTGALTVKSPSATGEQLILKIENAVSTGAIGKITFNQTNDEMHLSNEATGSLVFDIATVEKMRIDSSGNVGIGTNSPSTSLQVQGIPTTLGDARYVVRLEDNTAMAAGVGGGIVFSGEYIVGTQANFAAIWSEKENAVSDNSDGQLHLGTRKNGGSPAISSDLVISSEGNVGIGTNAPASTLTVLGPNDATGGITLTSTETDTSNKIGRIKNAHYTNAEEPFTFVQTRSEVSDSIINLGGSSGVENAATRIGFWTSVNNTTLTGTEVMRINSAQNVGIGETSSMFADYKLQVRDDNNGDSNPLLISNKDFSVGTTQSVAINFGLRRDSGTHKPQAGRIRVGRDGNTWDAADANIDSYMDFSVYESNALSTKLTIASDGKVGIGTTYPGYKLEVAEDINGTANLLFLRNSDSVYAQTWSFQSDTSKDLVITGSSGSGGIKLVPGSRGLTVTGYVSASRLITSDGIQDAGSAGSESVFNSGQTTANFRVATTGNANTLFIDGGTNNVGIGTTTPMGNLSVTGSSAAVGDQGIFQVTDGTGANTDTKIVMGVVASDYGWIQAVKPGTNVFDLVLQPNGGNVGIGTDDPSGKFVVSNGGAEGIEFFTGSLPNQNTTQHYNRSGSAYVKNRTIALNHEWVNGATDPAMNLVPDGDSTFLVIKARASTYSSTANLSLYGTNPSLNGGSLVSRATIQAQTDGTAFGTKLSFFTNNTSNVETKAITIDAAQKVGIGTDTPSASLSIFGVGSANTYAGVIKTVNTSADQWAHITLGGSATNDIINNTYIIGRGSTVAARELSFHVPNASQYSDTTQPIFRFASSGADTLMTITASTGAVYIKGAVSSGVITSSSGIKATNTWFNNDQPATDNAVFSGYGIIGNRASYYVTNGGGTVQIGNGSIHNSDPTATFSTTEVNLGASRTLAMNGTTVLDASRNLTNIGTISTSGDLLVGTTSQINSSKTNILGTSTTNVLGLKTENGNYLISGYSLTTEVFRVASSGNVLNTNNSYGSISDERLKSNIVDASSQLDDIMAVQVRSYTLNSTGETHIGVVAQELEASGMSGLVAEDKEGIKSVKYSVLYMKAIKAMQEQQAIIEALTARIAALES